MKVLEKICIDGVIIIVVNCPRSTILEANKFRELIKGEIYSHHNKLVIDLTKCNYIDSTFFGAIMMTLELMSAKGYKLKIVKPAISGESIFATTHTLSLFEIFKTREEAIKSFNEDFQHEI